MAPRGGYCREVQSHSKFIRNDSTTMKTDSYTDKSVARLTEKYLMHSANNLKELLHCPICKISMYLLIYQCPNGHTIRCLSLEKVAESLELPCRYQSLGCNDIFPYYTKLKHEQHCHFRPYNCPYAGCDCSAMGDIATLVEHLKGDHHVDMHDGCTFNHQYVESDPNEVEYATWMLTVFNCFGRQFCLHFEAFQLGTSPVYMAFLQFMGEDSEASKFGYSIEVGGFGRKLVWQGIPRTIRDNPRKIRDSLDGLIIPRNLALFFSGGNGQELKLRVTGRIWNHQESD